MHAHGQWIYALHPALKGFLEALTSTSDSTDPAWRQAFVDVMGHLADQVASEPPHVQRPVFTLHSANFHTALTIAERVGMDLHVAALAQALAAYAQSQRDFAQAEQWYRKSLAISEKLGNEHGTAIHYHQLGMIAQERRDFTQAEQRCRKSLAIKEKLGDEHGAALTYHQLGMIAQAQRNFAKAGQWYMRSIVIFFRRVQELAGERWPEIRTGLLAQLRGSRSYVPQGPIEIFLHEGLVEDAMRAVEGSTYYTLIEQVVDAAIPSHPDWAIRMSRQQAESIMNQGKSQYYRQAGRWLEKAQAAYRAAGRETQWQTYLGELIAQHRRKYSLMPMLEALMR